MSDDETVRAADRHLRAAGAGDRAAIDELLRLCPALKALADGGHTRARTLLGVIFMLYVDAPGQTIEFLSQSAAEGDPVAQRTLGYLLERGEGVEADPARAVELFRSAAGSGDGIAAFNLAMHSAKDGDSTQALRWLRVAAASGVPESYAHLGNQLSALDLDEEALHWYVTGAERGRAECMYVAACWFRDGIGTGVDLVQSLRWFLAMLDAGRGDGLHEAHAIAPRMSAADLRRAAALAGRPADAEVFLDLRNTGGPA